MKKKIEIAKCTLADMFSMNVEDFDRSITRKSNVIEARRFLIYYLVDDLSLKFVDVPNKMKCISTHASAIHHFYRMIDLMDTEETTKKKYLTFKNNLNTRGVYSLEKHLDKLIDQRKLVNWNIKKLKQMINEA
jgi:hypothetical protein|tara:strand:- start:1566 stop:1964 length:399 start_codon:yes stop_codon:yes gene_type:complete